MSDRFLPPLSDEEFASKIEALIECLDDFFMQTKSLMSKLKAVPDRETRHRNYEGWLEIAQTWKDKSWIRAKELFKALKQPLHNAGFDVEPLSEIIHRVDNNPGRDRLGGNTADSIWNNSLRFKLERFALNLRGGQRRDDGAESERGSGQAKASPQPNGTAEPYGWRSGLPVPDPNDPHAPYGHDLIRGEDGGAEALDFAVMLGIIEPLPRNNPAIEEKNWNRFRSLRTQRALDDSTRIRERIQNIYERNDFWNLSWREVADILRELCEDRGLIPRRTEPKPAESEPTVTVQPEDGATEPVVLPDPEHNPDFTWVRWDGVEYDFKLGIQARVVELLWNEWEAKRRGLSELKIGEMAGSEATDFRIAHNFRGHRAIGKMIVKLRPRVYALRHSSDE